MTDIKRITMFAGHYGSGKTNIAVNYAVMLKKRGYDTAIADLDIVNPYYRTKDSMKVFEENGIELISSEYAGSNVDLPALPASMYDIINNREKHYVLDIGGDDRGAYVLGRLYEGITEENDYEMLFVFNRFRPLTDTPEKAYGILKEIETVSRIPFTSLVNNSNIGEFTDSETVKSSEKFACELSSLSGLPVKFTSVREDLLAECGNEYFPLVLQKKIFDI